MQAPAGEGGLQDVRGVERPLRGPRTDDRVQLVDEEDDVVLALTRLLDDVVEALLELAAVLRPRDDGSEVEDEDALLAEARGDVLLHDALGEALGDRRLPDPRFPDEDRVVLRLAIQDVDDAIDLRLPADDGVELPRPRLRDEVGGEVIQHGRLALALRSLLSQPLRL